MSTNLSRIMSNIYGDTATQDLDTISFSGGLRGGSAKILRATPHVKYVDVNTTSASQIAASATAYNTYNKYSGGFNLSGGFSGGAKTEPIQIYAGAEYVPDEGVKKFLDEFYLHYLVANSNSNTILVVPPDDVLKKLIGSFRDELKGGGIADKTPEASKYAAKCMHEYKNYIFDVFDRSTPNNDGYDYRVPQDYPETTADKVLRRTNRLQNTYFFEFGKDIKVATNDKMTGASTLKFVAKCANSMFIVRGQVPAMTKSAATGMSGGAKSSRKSIFMNMLDETGNLEQAAYKYLGSISPTSAAVKYYSGNFVHGAFAAIADNDADYSIDMDLDDEEIDMNHEEILNAYKPVKLTIKSENVRPALKQLRKRSFSNTNGELGNANFINGLKKLYNSAKLPTYVLKADVGTSIAESGDVEFGLDVMDMFDKPAGGYMNMLSNNSTPLASTISYALISKPFIGCVSKSYVPMLMGGKRKRKSGKKIGKKMFEDNMTEQNDEDTFGFSVIDDVPTTTSTTPVTNEINEFEPIPTAEQNAEPEQFDNFDEFVETD